MPHPKTKIVLDADVIIHFMKAGRFAQLPEILPEYEFLILDVVYDELSKYSQYETIHRQLPALLLENQKRILLPQKRVHERILSTATNFRQRGKCLHDLLQRTPRRIGKQQSVRHQSILRTKRYHLPNHPRLLIPCLLPW